MTKFRFLALFAALALLFIVSTTVLAQGAPKQPQVFTGEVMEGPNNAMKGTDVTAMIDGETVGMAMVMDDEGNYSIKLDPGDPSAEGYMDFTGKTVMFMVGMENVEKSEMWMEGTVTELNLMAMAMEPEPTEPVMMPGPRGPAGQRGPTGPDGPDGPVGPDGKQGRQGPKGSDRRRWQRRRGRHTTARNGTDGRNGSDGANGSPGNDGSNGSNGRNGSNGAAGADGPAGSRRRNGRNRSQRRRRNPGHHRLHPRHRGLGSGRRSLRNEPARLASQPNSKPKPRPNPERRTPAPDQCGEPAPTRSGEPAARTNAANPPPGRPRHPKGAPQTRGRPSSLSTPPPNPVIPAKAGNHAPLLPFG